MAGDSKVDVFAELARLERLVLDWKANRGYDSCESEPDTLQISAVSDTGPVVIEVVVWRKVRKTQPQQESLLKIVVHKQGDLPSKCCKPAVVNPGCSCISKEEVKYESGIVRPAGLFATTYPAEHLAIVDFVNRIGERILANQKEPEKKDKGKEAREFWQNL